SLGRARSRAVVSRRPAVVTPLVGFYAARRRPARFPLRGVFEAAFDRDDDFALPPRRAPASFRLSRSRSIRLTIFESRGGSSDTRWASLPFSLALMTRIRFSR